MKDKILIDFMLLNGYSLDSFCLLNGKLGTSLCLFECSKESENSLAEEHAFNLLEEVLASSMKKYSFYEGKIGVAWTLIYLLQNGYIDVDYQELYGEEHEDIISSVERMGDGQFNAAYYVDAMIFLMQAKEYISSSAYSEMSEAVSKRLKEYFSILPKNIFECELFYDLSSKALACYNLYQVEMKEDDLANAIYLSSTELSESGYIHKNPLFGVNLLQYALYGGQKEREQYAVDLLKSYIENFNIKAMTFREAVNIVYVIDRLQRLKCSGCNSFLSLRGRVEGLLQDKESFLYQTDRLRLVSLKEGIPRLLFMRCLQDKDIDFKGHLIMA